MLDTKKNLIADLALFIKNSEPTYNKDKTIDRSNYLLLINRVDQITVDHFESKESFKFFSDKYQNNNAKDRIQELFKDKDNYDLYTKIINYFLWLKEWLR